MIAKRIAGATRYLGAPKGWDPDKNGDCSHLAIQDTVNSEQQPVMVSAWEPTPAELRALNDGKPVFLQVWGTGHPPVAIWVEAGR